MMQKCFVFLLIIWNLPLFAPGKTTKHLQVSLGCQAVIPCQGYRHETTCFKWLYKKNEQSDAVQIFVQDKKGVPRHQEPFYPRKNVLNNGSLVINNLTEDDQGLYWCECCCSVNCVSKQQTISLKKEILNETNETIFIAAGSNITLACPGKVTNLKWTFEASNITTLRNLTQRLESDFVTVNKSIHIEMVKITDAGKYTCWKSRCDGHQQKLLTINLCVFTEHHSEDLSVPCAVICDMDFSIIKLNKKNCSTKQVTLSSSNSSDKTAGTSRDPGNRIHICGTSVALTCIILMVLLTCFFRQRLWAALRICLSCCKLTGRVEEETSIVYSSIIIRGPAKTANDDMTLNSCVYSEIKV